MNNNLPWAVYCSNPQHPDLYRLVTSFGTQAEAEMHCAALNKLSVTKPYKVCFQHPEKVVA